MKPSRIINVVIFFGTSPVSNHSSGTLIISTLNSVVAGIVIIIVFEFMIFPPIKDLKCCKAATLDMYCKVFAQKLNEIWFF